VTVAVFDIPGVNDQIDLSTYAQFMVGFSVPEPPEQNAIIPA
jgi:hypothetical protein